jgi:hypothetical protein
LPVNSRSGGFVFADTLDDFVLHVGDVHDVCDGVALEFEGAADEVAEDERAPVADVREVIDGRPAAIHADFFAAGSSGVNSWTERESVLNSFKAICVRAS